MNPLLLYPFILVAGALQAAGNSMNARLRNALVNPWLAATVSFALIVFVSVTLFFVMPTPLPSLESLAKMPWWAPVGGLAGAVAVFGGLLFVDKVGAGPFNGLLTSLALDHFGWLGMPRHRAGRERLAGAVLMVAGIVLIAVF
ncbi:MAG TPA: DMT family transporter [Methylobacterium sp.]|nr:DMT family transporter [Methylobacterium sp.]